MYVQAKVVETNEKKTRGLAVLLVVSREHKPRPNCTCGWLVGLFCVKRKGVGRGEFVTLSRVSSQKTVQSQRIFP